jgi:hypothetical protein
VVGPGYIRNNTVGTENYDNIIKFSPSVQNVEPTGAGLQQNFAETIRGFNYKQFNSTFDGLVLPGTISSFAPQTGAYFSLTASSPCRSIAVPEQRRRSATPRSAAPLPPR